MFKILLFLILVFGIFYIIMRKGVFAKKVYLSLHNTEGDYEEIDFNQVKNMLEDGNATLLDVRTIEEVNKTGIIRGGINIPIDELEKKLNLLDKNSTYITICALGGRSKTAASLLSKNGFEEVYNTIEGMSTWPYSDMVEKNITKIKRL